MDNLNVKIKEIEKEIEEQYGENCIPDGIVDVKKYQKEEYKILWILKEPHDKGRQENWDMRDLLKNAKYSQGLNPDLKYTFPSIIYTTYGILNGFKQWDDIDNIDENFGMIDILKRIAFINIKKLPAAATSKDSEIQAAFDNYEYQKIINK